MPLSSCPNAFGGNCRATLPCLSPSSSLPRRQGAACQRCTAAKPARPSSAAYRRPGRPVTGQRHSVRSGKSFSGALQSPGKPTSVLLYAPGSLTGRQGMRSRAPFARRAGPPRTPRLTVTACPARGAFSPARAVSGAVGKTQLARSSVHKSGRVTTPCSHPALRGSRAERSMTDQAPDQGRPQHTDGGVPACPPPYRSRHDHAAYQREDLTGASHQPH